MTLNNLGIVLIWNFYLRMTLHMFGLILIYDFEKTVNFIYFRFLFKLKIKQFKIL